MKKNDFKKRLNKKDSMVAAMYDIPTQEYETIKQEMQRSFDEVAPGIQDAANAFLDDNPDIKANVMKHINAAGNRKEK